MCGIAGKIYFDTNQSVDATMISGMTKAIAHRGPNDSGMELFGSVGLGHRRLSILDLSPLGHQPMYDNEKTICLVFNGEIYNFLELKQELERDGVTFRSGSDTEVILALYKKYGVECVSRLRGMFAFALWDIEKQQLFLARDRVGKKPLKYYIDDRVCIFASELKAILTQKEVEKAVDWDAIDAYLSLGFVPSPKTGFQNIWKLEPGQYMLIDREGKVETKSYWDLNFSEKENYSQATWLEKMDTSLRESVRLRLISDVPLGAHLSGGVDSSVVVAMMAQEMSEPVKTFSIGFEEARYNELHYAGLVAKKYKTDHHECILKPNALEVLPQLVHHYEEPYADSSAIPTWYLAKYTKSQVSVALNGDGGDENFAGYRRFQAVRLFERLRAVPFQSEVGKISRWAYQKTDVHYFERLHSFFDAHAENTFDFYLKAIGVFGKEERNKLLVRENVEGAFWYRNFQKLFESGNSWNTLDQFLYLHFKTSLPDDLLTKVDIGAMAHGLEVRSPLLDHTFLELSARMPENLKLHWGSKKYILKKLAEKYIPKECIYRKKQGFSVPLDYWFRGELFDFLKERILDPKFFSYGFKKDSVEQLLQDHKNQKQDASRPLYTLLMLRLWLQHWFE